MDLQMGEPKVRLEEFGITLTPAEGVSTEQMLKDADPQGHLGLTVNDDGSVYVLLHKEPPVAFPDQAV